ncbi:MAG: hypothetical protein IRY99_22780 [Isosphaeraceae bacterium]|nr:hypothetical protein [Isosphaeraceae bacterium]
MIYCIGEIAILVLLSGTLLLDESHRPRAREVLRRARQAIEAMPEGFSADFFQPEATRDMLKAEALRDIALAMAESGDIAEAMRTAELLPPQIPYAARARIDCDLAIAKAQAKAGDRRAAAATLRQALEATARWSDAALRVDYLVRIAIAQAQVGEKEAATATARQALAATDLIPLVRSRNSRVAGQNKALALHSVALAQEAAGDRAGAEATRHLALDAASAIEDEPGRAGLLAEMAIERARAGDITGGLQLLDRIPGEGAGLPSHTWAHVLAQFALILDREKDQLGALRMVARIADPHQRALALLDLARSRLGASDRAQARIALQEALRAIASLSNPLTKGVLQGRVAAAQADAGDRSAAAAMARQALQGIEQALQSRRTTLTDLRNAILGDPGAPPDEAPMLAAIAPAFIKIGDTTTARDLLRRAQSSAEAIKDGVAKTTALGEVAILFAEIGDPAAATLIYDRIDPRYNGLRARLAEAIAAAQARSGDMAQALCTVATLPSDPKDLRGHIEIAERIAATLIRAGRVEWSLQWAEGQAIPLAKARALLGAGRALLEPERPAEGTAIEP